MTPRAEMIDGFLQAAGWQQAQRAPLAGDASTRRYHRLNLHGQSAVLMDNPPGGADDPAQFAAIAAHLAQLGLSPPRILAQDLQLGLLLLEDLGNGVFAQILAADPSQEQALYTGAVDVLHHIQANPSPQGLPNLSALDWAEAAMLAPRNYAAAITGTPPDETGLRDALAAALARHADGPRVMILRDYHAENLMDLPQRAGVSRVGLLDFQLAQLGQPEYDLVSLLQDARRDVSPQCAAAMLGHWANLRGQSVDDFSARYATLGAQRALRILGIFARLCTHSGKAGYLPLMPRVWRHLQANLSHPALADLAKASAATLPAPSPAVLSQLRSQCKNQS